MKFGFGLIISILLLASIGLVVGEQITSSLELGPSTPSQQIEQSSAEGSLASSANDLASDQKVFVGSIKSNKYHYPDCTWAKKIKPENEIWFSSSADAIAHGYVPCKVCNPP
jgi:hypothetical protein